MLFNYLVVKQREKGKNVNKIVLERKQRFPDLRRGTKVITMITMEEGC